MRVLITGASGFAGQHLARACAAAGDDVLGVSRRGPSRVDLRDQDALRIAVKAARPEVIYHLAALSHVERSWEDPGETVQANIATAVNLLEAVRQEAAGARVLWVSSCQVYGPPAKLPVDEAARLNPVNPYAISKTAGDLLAGVYADAHGLDIIRVRPFNHAGPGQLPILIVSSLAKQAAEARLAGASSIKVVTGNPSTRRDFTDVRDVVEAYRLLVEYGAPGVYNVSSGRSVSAAEQVAMLGELLAPIGVDHVVDPARVRAHEVMDLHGSNDRIAAATGWKPTIPLRQTMQDTIEWWEGRLAGTGESVRRATPP